MWATNRFDHLGFQFTQMGGIDNERIVDAQNWNIGPSEPIDNVFGYVRVQFLKPYPGIRKEVFLNRFVPIRKSVNQAFQRYILLLDPSKGIAIDVDFPSQSGEC